jgi:hypothetical protein
VCVCATVALPLQPDGEAHTLTLEVDALCNVTADLQVDLPCVCGCELGFGGNINAGA